MINWTTVHDFEVPPAWWIWKFERSWQQFEEARKRDEVDPDDEDKKKSEDDLRAEYERNRRAQRTARVAAGGVGRLNNIDVPAEEVNQAMSARRKYPGQEHQVMEF